MHTDDTTASLGELSIWLTRSVLVSPFDCENDDGTETRPEGKKRRQRLSAQVGDGGLESS